MTQTRPLPDGFVVQLHEDVEKADVETGALLSSGSRVVRLTAAARSLLPGRDVRVGSTARSVLAARLLDLDLADPVLDGVEGPGIAELTVVVPVRNDHEALGRLLEGLVGVACVVVDDASTDVRTHAVVADSYGAQLVALDHNVGPAAARNVGLGEITTPFVAFIDADVQVTVDALRALLRHFHDPGLAAVAPRVRSASLNGSVGRYEQTCGSLDLGPTSATTRPWSPVAYVPSACLVARRDALEEAFDTGLRSGEDVDLVWRLQGGHRVRYAADIEVSHDVRPTWRSWLVRKAFYGTSAAPLAARHGDRVAPAAMTPEAAVAVAGILFGRRWSRAIAAAATAVFIRRSWTAVPDLPARRRTRVLCAGITSICTQTSGLLLRHWSPAALFLAVFSRRARTIWCGCAVADAVLAHHRSAPDLDLLRFAALRRTEHIAYGTGVWVGAVKARSARCLVPRWVRSAARDPR